MKEEIGGVVKTVKAVGKKVGGKVDRVRSEVVEGRVVVFNQK